MAMKLEGKVVVVTGGSSGIGKEASILFAKKGAKVAVVARRQDVIDKALVEISEYGEAQGYSCDVSSEPDVKVMAERIESSLGKVDVLVNNAGFAIYGSVESLSSEQIRAHMETNYFGTVHCTKAFLPQMLARNSGHIVNVASVAASFGLPGMAAYCASKFAMLGFSEALRGELRSTKVGVTVVSPIAVRTPFFDHESFANIPRYSPMSLKPQKVARAIVKAVGSNKREVMVPYVAELAVWTKYTFPWIIDQFVMSKFAKTLKESS